MSMMYVFFDMCGVVHCEFAFQVSQYYYTFKLCQWNDNTVLSSKELEQSDSFSVDSICALVPRTYQTGLAVSNICFYPKLNIVFTFFTSHTVDIL